MSETEEEMAVLLESKLEEMKFIFVKVHESNQIFFKGVGHWGSFKPRLTASGEATTVKATLMKAIAIGYRYEWRTSILSEPLATGM